MKHVPYLEAKDADHQVKSEKNQPTRGITFAEMLAQADAVQDQVWIKQHPQHQAGGFQQVAGSIQSALAAVLQPVPWIGLHVVDKKPRRV